MNNNTLFGAHSSKMTSRLYDPGNPLSPAWLASILEKKLTKQQYLRTSISESAKAIENNTVISTPKEIDITASQVQFDTQNTNGEEDDAGKEKALTLRVSGQLLYGVVKIYSRKTRYLHDDASVSLIQLKSAFSLNKSIQLDTSAVELDKVLLKDKVEEIGILYNDFSLDAIFKGTKNTEAANTSIEYEGDISVGRGMVQDMNDFGDDNDVAGGDNFADTTIDGLARRAVVNDDLDDIPTFELPLNLDKDEREDAEGGVNEMDVDMQEAVNDIADFQIDAAADVDLEFTIDDTTIGNNRDTVVEEDEYEEGPVETTNILSKPKRKYVKQAKEYENMDIVRTHRKKLVVDNRQVEISTEELKRSQREWPEKRELINATVSVYDSNNIDLIPVFMKKVGISWSAVKRRRVDIGEISRPDYTNNFEDFGDQSVPDFEVSGFNQHEEVLEQEESAVENVEIEEVDEPIEEPVEELVEEPVAEDIDGFESETEVSKGVEILSELAPNNTFKTITRDSNVSATASTFFDLLVLATSNKVHVEQSRLFGDISISIK